MRRADPRDTHLKLHSRMKALKRLQDAHPLEYERYYAEAWESGGKCWDSFGEIVREANERLKQEGR